jgi:hypothetical protein
MEAGDMRMSRKAGLALSFATGVSIRWLLGKGQRYPIIATSGTKWTPRALEVHPIITAPDREATLAPETHERYLDEDYCSSEAVWATVMLAALSDGMARIIYSAYRRKKTPLAINLIQEGLIELSKRFRTEDKWPGDTGTDKDLLAPSLEEMMKKSAKKFVENMDAEFRRRPYHYPKAQRG